MYDKLISTAQSVLSDKVEGVEMENGKVVLTSDNEGCVEFINNGKLYRLDFVKSGENEFDLSDKVQEEVISENVTEAKTNEGGEPASSEEKVMEEEPKTYSQEEVDNIKAEYESKLEEMKSKIEPTKVEPETVEEEINYQKIEDKSEETKEAEGPAKESKDKTEVTNIKTAHKPFYGDYADMIIKNHKTFI